MQHSEQWTEIAPGVSKYVHRWWSADAPSGCVCIVHGLGEHGGRYHPLAQDFVANGFAVMAFDQQGHGRSPESRGHIRSYASLLEDIATFKAWCEEQLPAVPIVFFGHSMGGNLVINYALRDYPAPLAIVSSSPMIEQVTPPHPWFVRLARIVLWLAPNLVMRSKVSAQRLMSDPAEQQMLLDDELFHSQLTLRLGGALLDSGSWALQHAHRLKVNLLLTHGTRDYMTSPMASMEFARRVGEACQLKILDGAMHDPFRDVDRQRAVELYLDFMRRQLSRARTA